MVSDYIDPARVYLISPPFLSDKSSGVSGGEAD